MRVNTIYIHTHIHTQDADGFILIPTNRGRPSRTVISSRLINGIICQAGDSKNINLSRVTAIKRLSGNENREKKRERRESRREGEWRRSLQFKRANARLRGKLTTNVTSFKDSRSSLSGSLGTTFFLRWLSLGRAITNNLT